MSNNIGYWIIGIVLFLILLNVLGILDLTNIFSVVGQDNPNPSSFASGGGGGG